MNKSAFGARGLIMFRPFVKEGRGTLIRTLMGSTHSQRSKQILKSLCFFYGLQALRRFHQRLLLTGRIPFEQALSWMSHHSDTMVFEAVKKHIKNIV